MNRLYVLLLRLFFGGFFAVLLTRFFYPGARPLWVGALAVFLVAMAYALERFHASKRKTGAAHEANRSRNRGTH